MSERERGMFGPCFVNFSTLCLFWLHRLAETESAGCLICFICVLASVLCLYLAMRLARSYPVFVSVFWKPS